MLTNCFGITSQERASSVSTLKRFLHPRQNSASRQRVSFWVSVSVTISILSISKARVYSYSFVTSWSWLIRLRPVFNNISWPPGAKFAPRGELGPHGWTLSRRYWSFFRGWTLSNAYLEEWTEGLHPWGITSPLGANFTPGGQLHPWGTKLKTGLVSKNTNLAVVDLLTS
jgi:hypothetical protein